jgi:tryptophan synthase alpha chain
MSGGRCSAPHRDGERRSGPRKSRAAASDTRPAVAPRLRAALAAPGGGKRAALMPYLTGGYPDLTACAALIETLADAGADIIELGVPFSDPIADGPVVQRSSSAALREGITTDDVFRLAERSSGRVPFVLLAYANTVFAYGPERFAARAAAAGVEGLVVPDLPVDEASGLAAITAAHGLSVVPLAAPTTTDARLDLIAAAVTSFIYCVSVTGVTGARHGLGAELPNLLARLRERTSAPRVVGFGISTAEQAAAVAGMAEGVIVGSALIDLVGRQEDTAAACTAARRFISELSCTMTAEQWSRSREPLEDGRS